MARVRCLMMQRDERALLDAWLGYHGYLFGLENLTVFDNGSTDPEVVATLRRYESAGCTILWHCKTDDDFAERQRHFRSVVAGWERELSYEMAIPLECNEFVALFDVGGLSCRRDDIESYLETLSRTEERFEIGCSLAASPASSGFYGLRPSSKPVVTIGSSERSTGGPRPIELTCVIPDGARASGEMLVGFPALASLVVALGVETALFGPAGDELPGMLSHPIRKKRARSSTMFDGRRYLERNPDVAAAGWPPLKHFLLHGATERRPHL